MSGTVILLIVIFVTYLLGKHAIAEGHRVEKQKKFMRDMENFDKIRNQSFKNVFPEWYKLLNEFA